MGAVSASEVNEYMADLGDFTGHGTIEVEEVDGTNVRLRWAYTEAALRPGGYISGPTMFTVCLLYTSDAADE